MPNNIAISVTADVADLTAKRAILSSELKAATKDLNDFAKTARTSGMTDALKASMLEAATAATEAREKIALLDKEVKTLRGDSEAGGLAGIAEGVKGAVAPLTEFRAALGEVGEALIAAFAVEQVAEFVKQMGEAAEKTLHTAETFGLTVGEVQRLNAQAALFGVPAEAMTTAMQRLDKSFSTAKQGATQQANAFKQIGIDLQGSYTQTQLLNAALEGLGRMDAGPAKIAAAMAIFGRNIQQIGPLLNLTSEQIEEAKTKIDEYGAVNEASAAKGIALAESLNENKVAAMGFGNVMTDALAPVFKPIVDGIDEMIAAFVKSYESGGDAKGVMEGLAFTVKATADVLGLFGAVCVEIFETVDGAIWFFQALFNPLIDAVVGACQAMWDAFKTFGDVARDALTFNWGAIGGDIRSGAARVASDVAAVSRQMGADSAAAFKKGAEEWMAGDKAVADYEAWSKKLWSGAGASAPLPKAGTGTTADDPNGNAKKGPGQVAEWTEQLHAQEVASGEFFKDQTAAELAFWQSKLDLTQAGSKEWLEVQSKIYEASKALAHQAYAEQLASLDERLAADKDNWTKEQADWTAKLDFIKAHYGAESKEYIDAYKGFEAAELQHQQQMAQIAKAADQERLAELAANLKTEATIRKANASAAEQTVNANARTSASPLAEAQAAAQILAIHQQMNAQDLADLQTTYAAADALRQQDIAGALAAYGTDSKQYAAAQTAKAKADNDFYNQHRTLENQMVLQTQQDTLKVRAAWQSAVDPVVQSFGAGVKGMLEGTETLTQALAHVGETILDVIISAIERWVAAQVVAMITGQGAAKAQAVSQIATNIAIAGSGGVASMAAAPFPIDLGAPAFGAAMAAQAAALGSIASFDVGTNYVPSDMMAVVHAGERIVPKADNAALMAALAGAGRAGPAGGDVHLHYAPSVHERERLGLAQLLANEGGHMRDWIKRQVRDGSLKLAPA